MKSNPSIFSYFSIFKPISIEIKCHKIIFIHDYLQLKFNNKRRSNYLNYASMNKEESPRFDLFRSDA